MIKYFMDFLGGSDGKASVYNVGDLGSIPGLGRSPGEGKGYPLQYSGLENSMDCTVSRIPKKRKEVNEKGHGICSQKKSKVKVKADQSCPTLCDPMDYSVHGTLQARILEWVAFPFSRGSSQPRDQTQVSHIAGGFFTS